MIGYGYWGPNLVRDVANTDGARVISVSDLDPEKLTLFRRRHPDFAVTGEFRDLLKDSGIDAIAIATPVHRHYELALAALEAGKHALIEKPVARTSEEARDLIERGGAAVSGRPNKGVVDGGFRAAGEGDQVEHAIAIDREWDPGTVDDLA